MATNDYKALWRKEQERIKRFIKSAETRGFRFPEHAIPKTPKRITSASVSRLKKITPATLYKKAKYYDPLTDSLLSGTAGRAIERSKAARKAALTRSKRRTNATRTLPGMPPNDVDDILNNIESMIAHWDVSDTDLKSYEHWKANAMRSDHRTLQNILDGAIARDGRRAVAIRLAKRAEEVNQWVMDILYNTSGREKAADELVWFATLLKGESLTESEKQAAAEIEMEFEYEDSL